MIYGVTSFKNLITLLCIIQRLMKSVSTLRCIQCLANEKGVCVYPYSPKNYEVDCAEYLENNLPELSHALGSDKSISKEFACSTTRATYLGENYASKDCTLKTMECNIAQLKLASMDFKVVSCELCYSEFCNSAFNSTKNPYPELNNSSLNLTKKLYFGLCNSASKGNSACISTSNFLTILALAFIYKTIH